MNPLCGHNYVRIPAFIRLHFNYGKVVFPLSLYVHSCFDFIPFRIFRSREVRCKEGRGRGKGVGKGKGRKSPTALNGTRRGRRVDGREKRLGEVERLQRCRMADKKKRTTEIPTKAMAQCKSSKKTMEL